MPINSALYRPEPHHQELGNEFFDVVEPAEFPKAIVRFRNQKWAEKIGLGELTEAEWVDHFAKFQPLSQNLTEPLSLRYHGHQFRHYNADLGDGRGFLFAQLRDSQNRLLDLGTKGSGLTPWSRTADGRLTLKGAVREVLATEMLEALGVNTSKTLSVIETGEQLIRHDEPSPTRSGVLVRLNHSHIRFGSFQRPAVLGRIDLLERLLRYSVFYYYPHLAEKHGLANDWEKDKIERSLVDVAGDFLSAVAENTAKICAQWMIAGFVHGVLNTDNMNITGESFDYGPYRFLPYFDPSFTAAYFDQSGLYSFGRQSESCIWNLEQLASCLALLIPEEKLKNNPEGETESLRAALQKFIPKFNEEFFSLFCLRLGVEPSEKLLTEVGAAKFLQSAFDFMKNSRINYSQFYFDWYGGLVSERRADSGPAAELYKRPDFQSFRDFLSLTSPQAQVSSRLSDPYFKRSFPTMMLIDEIEAIWSKIAEGDDWSEFYKKIEEVREMGKLYGFTNS